MSISTNELINYLNQDERLKPQVSFLERDYTSTKNLLATNYGRTEKMLKKQLTDQKQAADVSYQRLLRYLPEYNSIMGITGGASEGALLKAAAQHQSAISAAQSEYDQKLMDAKSKWDNEAIDADKGYHQSLMELYDTAKSREEDREKEERDEELILYNNILSGIYNGAYNAEGLMKYLNSFKTEDGSIQGLNEEYYKNLEAIAGDMIHKELEGDMISFDGDQASFEKAFGKYFDGEGTLIDNVGDSAYQGLQQVYNTKLSDYQKISASAVTQNDNASVSSGPRKIEEDINMEVNVGGVTYAVELADNGQVGESSPILRAANEAGVKNGGIFLYDGEVYYRHSNQVICRLRKRLLQNATNNDYTRLVKAMNGTLKKEEPSAKKNYGAEYRNSNNAWRYKGL